MKQCFSFAAEMYRKYITSYSIYECLRGCCYLSVLAVVQ
jgi:hypothetical protein